MNGGRQEKPRRAGLAMPYPSLAVANREGVSAMRAFAGGRAWLGLLLALVSGCTAGTFERLPRDRDLPEQGLLVQAAQRIPSHLVRVSVDGPAGQPVRLACHETPGPRDGRVVVLLHGILSDSRMWRYVRGDLGRDYDLWAVDLMGCGQSDSPDPDHLPPNSYGPASLARGVLQALRQRLADEPAPTRITLVGHSLGGMIALRMYADDELRRQFADVLERVDGLVLFTPVDVDIPPSHQTFDEVAQAGDWMILLADITGALKERCAAAILAGVGDPALATREEAQRVWEILRDRKRRRAAQAMILQAVPHCGGRPDRQAIARVVAGYANIPVPCLIAWGEWDDLFPLSMGYKLACEVPAACLRIVPRSMHCVPVEHPLLAAGLIRQLIEAGPRSPRIAWMDLQTRTSIAGR
jgi:pimeloyl-ACP methyl ester carboxylesterase